MTPRHCTAIWSVARHLLLLGGAAFILLPFVWMISTASKPQTEIFTKSIHVIPHTFALWDNFATAFSKANLWRFLLNGVVVTVSIFVLQVLIDLLAAVPSIVYGFWGLNIAGQYVEPVAIFLQKTLGWLPFFESAGISAKSTLFFAGIILAIMILPIITAISREVFAQVPSTHKEGALALGATQWEMIRTAVLPFGKPGVISGAMLGLGRALGETLAVMILLSGLSDSAPWSWSIFNGGATFASKIALNAGEFDTPQKTGAYIAAGLVLFILTFIVNAIARVIIERRKAFIE